jgi:uncharacterized protein (TIGR02466 family)
MLLRRYFFPTPIYATDISEAPSLNTQLEKDIMEWSQKDKGVQKTNVKGWHSTTDMNQKPEYKNIVDQLFLVIQQIWEAELLDRKPRLGNMWANINYPDSYNKPHVHPNSLFSGAYYVKSSPNSGKLILRDPRPGPQNILPVRKDMEKPPALWHEVEMEPKEGRVIIFPSWVWHEVEPNHSNETRISISFNFIQEGFQ